MEEGISHYIQSQHIKLHYVQYGEGDKIMVTFHGFGLDHSSFQSIENHLQKAYTFYNFDLFFHGESEWEDKKSPLNEISWGKLMEIFFEKHQIKHFSILAFSIGGRLAFTTLKLYANRIKEMFLIAPDGIHKNFIYDFSTGTQMGRKLFRLFLSNYLTFEYQLSLLRITGLVPQSTYQFVTKQLGNQANRERIYNTWLLMRGLYEAPTESAKLINAHQIKTSIFLGEKDYIITPKHIQPLLKALETYQLKSFPVVHTQMIKTVAKYFEEKENKAEAEENL